MLLRTLIIALGLSATLSSACMADQALSAAGFRDTIADQIRQQRPGICIQTPDEFTLNIGRTAENCAEMVVNTAYYYRQYVDDPANLSTYASALVDPTLAAISLIGVEHAVRSADDLLVLLRPDAYVESLTNMAEGQTGIWRPFRGDLIATLAHTQNDQVIYLRRADLAGLQMTEHEAWARAEANLRRRLGPVQRTANTYGAEHVAAPSGLATSALLLPESCRADGPDFDAFVLDRSNYLYADQAKPTATTMLAGYSAELLQTTEVYSQNLLSCINGQWYASVFNGMNAWLPIEESQR